MSLITKKAEFDKVIGNLVGEKAWKVQLGYGSFLTFDFGNLLPEVPNVSIEQGEWHLWVYLCSWRIEEEGSFLVGCEDKRSKIAEDIKKIENKTLISFDVSFPTLDATLEFENGIVLKTFSVISEDNDGHGIHWMLFQPSRKVLVAGPGSHFKVEEN